jgi:MFS family permease|tara:strand:+ start:1552 stop:2811 length:1260 start_codon:yes stop_codon:yes gene_type:complete
LPKKDTFAVFAIAQFRWLFMGNVAFFFAMQGQMLTRTIVAWDLTGQATSLAYINLVVAIPMIFASLVGGAITDRVERRQLVMIGQCLILLNDLIILGLLITDQLAFWHLLCTAFVAGCAFPFIMPARMAITATVVGPGLLQSGMAFGAAVMNLSRVFGPAIMGLLIAQYSATGAYSLSVVLYLGAILCMLGVKRSRSVPKDTPKKALLADIGEGFSYIANNRAVLITLGFGLVPMFLAMPFQSVLVVLAEQAWQVGEGGLGTLMAIGGVGGVFGSIWIVKRGEKPQRFKLMIGSTIAFGICLGITTQVSNFYLAFIPLLLANMFASASQTVNSATVQLLIDDRVRGRMSSFMMLSFALTPIGVFPMAMATDRIGAANAIVAASIILVAVVVAFVLLSKTLRGIDGAVTAKLERAKEQAA